MTSPNERQLIQAELVVAGILTESISWELALERVLAILCKALDWQMSEFWRHIGDEVVIQEAYISSERYRPMVEGQRAFGCGEGLPGRAWKTGGSIWSSELWADWDFKRSALATSLGLTTGLGVPVVSEDGFLGAVTLFASRRLDRNVDLCEMVERVAAQLAARAPG